MYRGSCLCGVIEYLIVGPIDCIRHCHCGNCRKFHGAAYASYAGIAPEHFRWCGGEDNLTRFASGRDSYRWFCSRCGSPLAAEFMGGIRGVTLATLERVPKRIEAMHIFVASKAAWDNICDELPQYPEYPPDLISN